MSRTRRRGGNKQRSSTEVLIKCDWSNLPNDILFIICTFLDTRCDLPRIRAVCKSWRSSVPSTPPENNPSSSRIFHINPCLDFTVEESTLYRCKYHRRSKSKSRGGEFIVKVQESQPCKFFRFNPKSYGLGNLQQLHYPKKLSLFNCHVAEFQKNYKVNFKNGGFSKAAYSVETSTLLFTYYGQKLVFIRAGEDKFTQVAGTYKYRNHAYLDITLYKGNFYAIVYVNSRWDRILVIDPLTMNLITTLTIDLENDRSYYHKKMYYFAQSRDDLYVVDRCTKTRRTCRGHYVNMTLDFEFYRLNESDCTWESVERKTMQDQSLFISDDCTFFASPAGFLGNSLYYTDDSNNRC